MTAQKKKTIGIIGLGLIGGSIALALCDKHTVVGMDSNAESVDFALKNGMIHVCARGLSDFDGCEVVFVCVPLADTRRTVQAVCDATRSKAIVTDVGSVKGNLHGLSGRIVGGHPMAGTEQSGIAAAKAHLFENAYYCLVPYAGTAESDVAAVEKIIKDGLHALPKRISADEHDRTVARISHLPHLAAYAMCRSMLAPDVPDITGSGFTDATRIALSDPEFWTNVFMLNSAEVLRCADKLKTAIDDMTAAIQSGDRERLCGILKDARAGRRQASYRKAYKTAYFLDVDVVDEVGSIGKAANLLAENGINIKNIAILNSREGEGGALRIEFADEAGYAKAKRILCTGGGSKLI